jgi:nucleotidyltransferase substrate binding protein (TIGR01987 family)
MDVRLNVFQEATKTFTYLAMLDAAELKQKLGDDRLVDGMQNGRAQKFEYTTELCWKAIKYFLKEQEGVDEAAPKKIIKAYYLGGNCTEDEYLLLLEAVEDRNRLSHIYDEATFKNILARLPGYATLFERVSAQLIKGSE